MSKKILKKIFIDCNKCNLPPNNSTDLCFYEDLNFKLTNCEKVFDISIHQHNIGPSLIPIEGIGNQKLNFSNLGTKSIKNYKNLSNLDRYIHILEKVG